MYYEHCLTDVHLVPYCGAEKFENINQSLTVHQYVATAETDFQPTLCSLSVTSDN